MNIVKNFSLKKYNTFGLNIKAKQFLNIQKTDDLITALQQQKKILVLGGGSNFLFTKNIEELVLHINIKGIEIIQENKTEVFIKAASGEIWHNFVLWCIEKNYGGIENLSLIPGSVGASPIQNIGAYGVEVKDVIHSVEVLNTYTQKIEILTNKECDFGYRNSIFKSTHKSKYIIISVTYKLTKNNHQLKLKYGDILNELEKNNIEKPTIKQVKDAVINIRNSKLPNPKEIGNSGSFFKNPIIHITHFKKLQQQFSDIKFFKISENKVKIPAGWLIEKMNWKGYTKQNIGVHKKQALILVNYGNGNGKDIFTLAKKIQKSILDSFNIQLEMEVNIY